MKKERFSQIFLATTFLLSSGGLLTSCNSCAHNNKNAIEISEPTEESNGKGTYYCLDCEKEVVLDIPKLTSADYKVSKKKATCTKPFTTTYASEKYGTYEVYKGDKLFHTSNAGRCDYCGELINGLEFFPEYKRKITTTGGYPRLYELKDGTWLCGYDTGKIFVQRSFDDGKTWSNPVQASFYNDAVCANVDFFELENGDILCSYRAIGGTDTYRRAIYSSISHDKGVTWEKYNTVVSNYELGYDANKVRSVMQSHGGVGFYEPYVDLINGKVTVMYADDFSTMAENVGGSVSENYRCQYIQSKELVNGTWTNSKIIVNGAVKKTVGNNTRVSRDGMPVYAQMHDGTYVLVFEGTYRDRENPAHPFEILLSYSKDGENWSDPVEIYVPSGSGTKASAPYVCVTEDDRLIVSFQTDEDCYAAGKGVGDGVSIMKTMISDGTPIDKITADSFYTAANVFGTKPGKSSLWNGMMISDNTIYCCTGTDGAVYINSSEIPPMDPINTYSPAIGKPEGYDIQSGDFEELENGTIRVLEKDSLAYVKDCEIYDGTISCSLMLKNKTNQAGIVFRMDEDELGYYFSVNSNGKISLAEIKGNKVINQIYSTEDYAEFYDPNNGYTLEVKMKDNNFDLYVNKEEVYSFTADAALNGKLVGIKSFNPNTIFSKVFIL